MAEAQKRGGTAASSTPSTRSTHLARKLGVKIEDLLISQPDTGEQALEIAEAGALRRHRRDRHRSVAALTPKAEIEGEMGETQMGSQARLMSQAMRKLTGSISKSS